MNALQVVWIVLQGSFLPFVLWFDQLRMDEKMPQAILVFLAYEALLFLDSIIFLKLFKGETNASKEGKK
jgi:hypothetical protein